MTPETVYTDDQLLKMLANATKTYYQCGGHTKAAGNERNAKKWKELLKERNVPIPEDKELLEVGVFNGDGSW